jgi:hypothetical protein
MIIVASTAVRVVPSVSGGYNLGLETTQDIIVAGATFDRVLSASARSQHQGYLL